MTKRLRVIAIVVFILAVFTATVSAYDKMTDSEGDGTLSVIINLDGVPRMVSTEEQTVGSLLKSIEDIPIAEYALDSAEEEDELSNNMVINLTSVKEHITKTTESVAYTIEKRENSTLAKGTQRVLQQGTNGEAEITIKETYNGDELLNREELTRKITKTATNQIIEVGTAENVVAGQPYAKTLNVVATGYTPYDPGCNGITASGTPAKKGVIAVDPRVIPMGTKLYIPGYGTAVAEDTGGAIKGNKIDLCYETKTEAYNWGIRNVTVYVLDK